MKMILLAMLFMSVMNAQDVTTTKSPTAPTKFTTLQGSRPKVIAAYEYAVKHDYSFVRDAEHFKRFIAQGLLVELPGNENYTLVNVSYPYARPAAKLMIERLSLQYRNATGQVLNVTSATRAQDSQPWNASQYSVHPTGMAVDFRIPSDLNALHWLQNALLTMQSRGVVLATKENNPPHFHVVVLGPAYTKYVASKK
jgi:hypothetical protein